MSNAELTIDLETENGATIVTPLGNVDLSKSASLRAAIHKVLQEQSATIIVDLNAVSYMDSSGVATLIEGLQLAKNENKEFLLCELTEGVKSIIELARLDKIFDIFENREAALEN
mgnify:CR=1 FL=1